MDGIRLLTRNILLGLLSFGVLTFLLFVYWRHFPVNYLIFNFINPHSQIPLSVQVQMAKEYLHLDLPVYLQYFGFLLNVFTGKWAYSQFYNPLTQGYYSYAVHPFIVYIIPSTLFMMFLGSAFFLITAKILHGSNGVRQNRVSSVGNVVMVTLISLAVPIMLKYVVFALGFVYHPANVLLSGPGYDIVSIGGESWATTYVNGVLVHTGPTGVPFIDALINLNLPDAAILLRQMLPVVISVAAVLFLSFRILRKNGHASSKVYFLAFALIFSTAFAEYIFNYFGGLGFYGGFLNPLSNYAALYTPPEYDIWLQVYLLLVYGVMAIIFAIGSSVIKSFHREKQ